MIYKSISPLLFIRFYRTLMSTVSPAIDSTSSSSDDAVISSCTEPKKKIENDNGQTSKKPKKPFDFIMWNKRHIAFKVAYLGWEYHGFASQGTIEPTVESQLFQCLLKTKLIEDPQQCNYSRSGRTDKGVSALGQVISLHVRSALLSGPGVIATEGTKAQERSGDKSVEISYMQILNRVLPDDIRILAWAPVEKDFSARFSCVQRVYKYFFPLGTMNIELMRTAAKKFVGEHDFRNFCKMDIAGGVTNFKRRIFDFTVNPLYDNSPPSPYQLNELTITGQAFLWHQVRCMASILFLIGSGLEQPEVIDHMLDVEKCPRKPQYGMAADYPLILYDCGYEKIKWEVDEYSYRNVLKHFQQLWTKQMINTTMIRCMLDSLELPLSRSDDHVSLPSDQMSPLIKSDHKLGGSYKSLLTRPSSDPFETRYEHHQSKKRKIEDI